MDIGKVIKGLETIKQFFGYGLPSTAEMFDSYYGILNDAIALLKEQEAVVRCKDCENWIPGYITDHDDFIPPKCGKYQQMVGHSAADYSSLAERKERR